MLGDVLAQQRHNEREAWRHQDDMYRSNFEAKSMMNNIEEHKLREREENEGGVSVAQNSGQKHRSSTAQKSSGMKDYRE